MSSPSDVYPHRGPNRVSGSLGGCLEGEEDTQETSNLRELLLEEFVNGEVREAQVEYSRQLASLNEKVNNRRIELENDRLTYEKNSKETNSMPIAEYFVSTLDYDLHTKFEACQQDLDELTYDRDNVVVELDETKKELDNAINSNTMLKKQLCEASTVCDSMVKQKSAEINALNIRLHQIVDEQRKQAEQANKVHNGSQSKLRFVETERDTLKKMLDEMTVDKAAETTRHCTILAERDAGIVSL